MNYWKDAEEEFYTDTDAARALKMAVEIRNVKAEITHLLADVRDILHNEGIRQLASQTLSPEVVSRMETLLVTGKADKEATKEGFETAKRKGDRRKRVKRQNSTPNGIQIVGSGLSSSFQARTGVSRKLSREESSSSAWSTNSSLKTQSDGTTGSVNILTLERTGTFNSSNSGLTLPLERGATFTSPDSITKLERDTTSESNVGLKRQSLTPTSETVRVYSNRRTSNIGKEKTPLPLKRDEQRLRRDRTFICKPNVPVLEFGQTFVKTHPGEMDGASRLKQHDNVHKQIAAFEKLLQHAMSKFSKDKLYQMLKAVSRGIPDLKIPRGMHSQSQETRKITSTGDLRDILEATKSSKHKGIQKEEQAHLQNYFESFFDDLFYLKDLKKYFDQKIYTCLYEYFYDPIDEVDLGGYCSTDREEKDSGHSSLGGSEDDISRTLQGSTKSAGKEQLDLDETYINFDILDERERFSYAVKALYQVNQKWDVLFSDQELDESCFDPDSRYEMLAFPERESIESILRLVPDVFVKAYKSIELAKLWWTQANKVYDTLPAKKNSTREFDRKTRELENQIARLRDDIHNEGELLALKTKDLANLRRRESKYNELSENFQQVEERKNDVGQKYNEIYVERDALMEKFKSLKRGTNAYRRVQERATECNQKLVQTHSDLKLLSYHFEILKEDFNLEMSFRPDIIRFVADVNQKIDSLETSIQLKRELRRNAEKKLVLLRTNCERMRQIMRKYIGSAASCAQSSCEQSNDDVSDDYLVDEPMEEDVVKAAEPRRYPEESFHRLPKADKEYRTRAVRHKPDPYGDEYPTGNDITYPRSPRRNRTDDVYPSPRPRDPRPAHPSYLAEAMDNGLILLDETIQEDEGMEADTDTPSPKRSKPKPRPDKSKPKHTNRDEFQLRYEYNNRRQPESNHRSEKLQNYSKRSRIPMNKARRKDPEY